MYNSTTPSLDSTLPLDATLPLEDNRWAHSLFLGVTQHVSRWTTDAADTTHDLHSRFIDCLQRFFVLIITQMLRETDGI